MGEFEGFQLTGKENLNDLATMLERVSFVQNNAATEQLAISDTIGEVTGAASQIRGLLGNIIEVANAATEKIEESGVEERAHSSTTDALETMVAVIRICNDNDTSETSSEAGWYAIGFQRQAKPVPGRIQSIKEQLNKVSEQINAVLKGPMSDLEKKVDQTLEATSNARSAGVDASLATEAKARRIRGAFNL